MFQRTPIVSIILVCFLWTGTFLHDVDQLELSFLWNGVQQNAEVHSGHDYGHSHSGGYSSKQIGHRHGSAPKELAVVSDEEMHGHDPLLLGSGHRDASSDDSNLPAVAPIAFGGIGFVSKGAAVTEACRPRPPPDSSKVPIYLLNRAILI